MSKSVGKTQQLAHSFDREHQGMTTLPALLLTIGVRPRPGNLHGAAIEVLNDDVMLVCLEHFELLVQERMMRASDLHPLGVFRRIFLVCDSLPSFCDSTIEVTSDRGVDEASPESEFFLESLLPDGLDLVVVGLE